MPRRGRLRLMPPDETEVIPVYQSRAAWFDAHRTRALDERPYLDAVAARLAPGADVLDLGCGAGDPIARYFVDRGFRVTGVDAATAMLDLCREKFPAMTWIRADLRGLALGRTFDAIVAWDSFFHLTRDEQRAMFPAFAAHARPAAPLLFTTGPADGEAYGDVGGLRVYHASFAADEYRALLAAHRFAVLRHTVNDPACGGHTVWLAEKSPGVQPPAPFSGAGAALP